MCGVYSFEANLMGTINISLIYSRSKKNIPNLFSFAFWTGAMINTQWLELPISRTNYYGPKDVRVIEVRLINLYTFSANSADNKLIITLSLLQEKNRTPYVTQIVFTGDSLKRQFVPEMPKPALREKKETT